MFTLVHKGTHQQQTPAGLAQEILLGQRVGDSIFIETVALIANGNCEAIGIGFEFQVNFFSRIVLVAMGDGVDHTLADSHRDRVLIVLVEADFASEVNRGLIGQVHAVQRGVQQLFHRFLLKGGGHKFCP